MDNIIRVFVKGGIISPRDFMNLVLLARELGVEKVHFGSRQDIFFPSNVTDKEILNRMFEKIGLTYDFKFLDYQNIVSSYVSMEVMPSHKWLTPAVYHYLLDSFDFHAKVKINFVDPNQSLVPLFTGELNFIASEQERYWYLYLRFQQVSSKPWPLPVLIFESDIPRICKFFEQVDFNETGVSYQALTNELLSKHKINTKQPETELVYPSANFPYYEGLNRIADGKYWLGLYWRKNDFSIPFIIDLCEHCIETSIGKISLTPWKSFIVKGIDEDDRVGWEKLLGKHGINMRHSSLELNWHLPVLDEEAMSLKNFLVTTLDQQDISTYGLTFTIKTTKEAILFTSVVIEKNTDSSLESYNVMYSKDFDPNSCEYFYFVKEVPKETLPPLLIELSKMYYEQIDEKNKPQLSVPKEIVNTDDSIYQCGKCLTIYDSNFGDEQADIAPGTLFNNLPTTYKCGVCGNPKKGFSAINVPVH